MKDVRLRAGPPVHPYVFSKRVLRAPRGLQDGEVVRMLTREGRPVGYAFWHSRSLIALRVLTYDPESVPDTAWLTARVRAADRLRRDGLRLPEVTDAWRVVHAEGDGLSGLVVDRYGAVGSVQLFSLGWQRRRDELVEVLEREAGLDAVVVRADARTAEQEGLVLPDGPDPGRVTIREHGTSFEVDPAGGHKTGFFLDQRENRARLAALARGRVVFDGMTYTGGFALACAGHGAASARAMDLDEDAIAQARRNAAHNDANVVFEHGDTFHALRAYAAGPEDERPDLLIVDPPKWARDRAGLGAALHRYRDLNRLALQAVRPLGLVCTCSCSGLVSEEALLGVVRSAALDTRREVRILSISGAAMDHPVGATFPEGRYLKCFLLAVGPEGSGPGQVSYGGSLPDKRG